MHTLNNNSILQGGRYKIIRVLGQGGFGITYLGEQSGLNRKVAIKEFFMKDYCSRDEQNSFVSVATESGKDLVTRFRAKFLKEARNIAHLNHPHIIRIIDVFEENGTAYYVMEYAENGSLADKVKQLGFMPENMATRYILQVAEALDYIHQRKMNHLDVKPGNILLNDQNETVLIDFGLSKQYDAQSLKQTSTTPVGISEGYAPKEQYKLGGVAEFSPETDIYSLGATFFKLLTGVTPPSASDIIDDGVPVEVLQSKHVSQVAINTICQAMNGRKKDRPHNVQEFVALLNETAQQPVDVISDETTRLDADVVQVEKKPAARKAEVKTSPKRVVPNEEPKRPASKFWKYGIVSVVLLIGIAISLWYVWKSPYSEETEDEATGEMHVVPIPKTGSLLVNSDITGATVYIDGTKHGVTPITLNDLTEGSHEVKLTKSGYEDLTQKVWVKAGETTKTSLLMHKLNQPIEPVSSSKQPMPNVQTITVTGNGKTVTFKMKKVEAGSFQMGSNSGGSDEKPVHRVTISKDYYIGETEVTQALWFAVMSQSPTSTGSQWTITYGQGNNYPAYYISYEDCQEFIRKLNQKTGKNFRMPTEAEWEFAARGGNKTKNCTYAGSNNINEVAWYYGNSGSQSLDDSKWEYDNLSKYNCKTHPVGRKQANELGLYDMSGNVWEWCYDWYDDNYYSSSSQTDPTGPSSSSNRVCRGGRWYGSAEYCRSASRYYCAPTDRGSYLGFRLAL